MEAVNFAASLIKIIIISIPLAIIFIISVRQIILNNRARAKFKEEKKRLLEVLKEKHQSGYYVVSPVALKSICVDSNNGKIIISDNFKFTEYDFAKINRVEIVKDQVGHTSFDRSSQALGAAIGGIAFGTAGAVVGALSAGSNTKMKVSELSLRIIVDDSNRPIFEITILRMENPKAIPMSHPLAQDHLKILNQLEALISNGIRSYNQSITKSPEPIIQSASDEIKKLWDLKEQGIITEEEFSIKKQKLLN